jgi:HEPN domain-containing protein
MANWKTALEKEFRMAAEARAHGNEGQARVCARRAAGVAIREYLLRRRIRPANPSAYELLKSLLYMPDLPVEVRQAAEYLTLRVNDEFNLPLTVDLVEQARILCQGLLPGDLP